ncbi:hypothetical protein BDN72DRAFT_741422, partial [Pluteus cervinus]
SIYDTEDLYPQIFPWLFPYGYGNLGAGKLSFQDHVKHLLMYHDKRFQTDLTFPFVIFSHQQIKTSSTGGFLLAKRDKFDAISERLLNIDQSTLKNIISRMSAG